MHRIILIILPVLEPFVFGEECQSFYTTQSLCDTIYGSTLSTYSQMRSLTECVVQCSIDELCLSVIYVNGSGDCRTNSGTLVTPDTGCLETVWYASLLQVSMSYLSQIYYCEDTVNSEFFARVLISRTSHMRSFVKIKPS